MEKYKLVKQLGVGTFGSVGQYKNISTGEVVAIKELKSQFSTWSKCVELSEVKSLAKLNHPNIVKLHEVIKQNNKLYLVFEYMEQNILQLLRTKLEKRCVNEIEIRNIIFQALQGIYFMHRSGYFHRDLKPENILEFKGTVKIADFGLAKAVNSSPPYTEYVSTRWYRAPELILNSNDYDAKIDIFAIGAIMAELYNGHGLFEGKSAQEQISVVFSVLGTPTPIDWEEGHKLARKMGFQLPSFKKQNLAQLIPGASEEAIDLLNKMFVFDHKKRISALDALMHPYFMVDVPMTVETAIPKPSLPEPIYPFKQSGNSTSIKPMLGTNKQPETLGGDKSPTSDESKIKKKNTTKYYLAKARYKVGVNIAELLKNQTNLQ